MDAEEEERIDQDEDYQDSMEEQRRGGEADMEFPTPKKHESLYNLFYEVLNIGDSSKVGNLDKHELGDLSISVRDCQRISMLGYSLHHPVFAEFFLAQSEIILSTSSSKKGWFTELFVSQKKLAQRAYTQTQRFEQPERRRKWPLGKKKNQSPLRTY